MCPGIVGSDRLEGIPKSAFCKGWGGAERRFGRMLGICKIHPDFMGVLQHLDQLAFLVPSGNLSIALRILRIILPLAVGRSHLPTYFEGGN